MDIAIKNSKKRKKVTKRVIGLSLMIAPAVVLLFLFSYIPLYGIIVSFKDYNTYVGILKSPWVGLKHYIYFLTDPTFYKVLKNTLIISFYDIIFGFTAPIVFALLANEIMNKSFKRVVQTISYLPNFLSWVVVAGLMRQLLDPSIQGMVNSVLVNTFGIEPIYFLGIKKLFVPMAVIIDIWKNVGFSAILYFATIAGISPSLYEAASVDGAGRLRQTWHITLPGMASIIVLLFLLRISSIFSVGFDRIFNMQNPMVYDTSEVISTYVYHIGIQQAQHSLTTAIGFAQSVLGFTLLIFTNKLSKKVSGLGLY